MWVYCLCKLNYFVTELLLIIKFERINYQLDLNYMPEMRNWIEIYQVNLSPVKFNMSRLKDETLFFKIEAIVIRKKTIVIFIRLGFIQREINWYSIQINCSLVKTLGSPNPNYFLNYSFKSYSYQIIQLPTNLDRLVSN